MEIIYVKDLINTEYYKRYIDEDCDNHKLWLSYSDKTFIDMFNIWLSHKDFYPGSVTVIVVAFWNKFPEYTRKYTYNKLKDIPESCRYMFLNLKNLNEVQELELLKVGSNKEFTMTDLIAHKYNIGK